MAATCSWINSFSSVKVRTPHTSLRQSKKKKRKEKNAKPAADTDVAINGNQHVELG